MYRGRPIILSNAVRQRHGTSSGPRAAGMRRPAGKLLAPASSHASAFRATAAPAIRPGVALRRDAAPPSAQPTAARPSRPCQQRQNLSLRRLQHRHFCLTASVLSKSSASSLSSSSSPPSSSSSSREPTTASAAPAADPPLDDEGRLDASAFPKLPFRFATGVALFAKRTPRPFPPPFLSPPSASFSDPLSTHDRSRDRRRRAYVGGHLIQGLTNGDDAVFASDYFIGANDGVGAWSTRPRGHAGWVGASPLSLSLSLSLSRPSSPGGWGLFFRLEVC